MMTGEQCKTFLWNHLRWCPLSFLGVPQPPRFCGEHLRCPPCSVRLRRRPSRRRLRKGEALPSPQKHDHTHDCDLIPTTSTAHRNPTNGWMGAHSEGGANAEPTQEGAPATDRCSNPRQVSAANSGLNHRRWFAEGAPATDPGGRCGSPQLTREVNLCQLRLQSQVWEYFFLYSLEVPTR